MGNEKKHIHFLVDQELYESFHRLFSGRGEKTIFFTKLMEIAVEKGRESSFVKDVWVEAERGD